MTPLDLLVIYGSVRTSRQGIKAARFILNECAGRGHDASLVDPAEERLPLLDKMYKEYPKGQAPEGLERLAGRIRKADAFIIVTGEYNHSIPPALSDLRCRGAEIYSAIAGVFFPIANAAANKGDVPLDDEAKKAIERTVSYAKRWFHTVDA